MSSCLEIRKREAVCSSEATDGDGVASADVMSLRLRVVSVAVHRRDALRAGALLQPIIGRVPSDRDQHDEPRETRRTTDRRQTAVKLQYCFAARVKQTAMRDILRIGSSH